MTLPGKHQGSTLMWTTEDRRPHRLANTSSKDALVQVHKRTQQNARERRPLTDALAQVSHKTLLVRAHNNFAVRQRTQTLFNVVNSIKLHLTAFNV